MIDPEFKKMMKAAVIDGSITDKKRAFILDKARAEGYDLDEVEIVLESFLAPSKSQKSAVPQKETVKKCPACGATITFQSKCPECGYVFTSLKANESSSKLYEELKKLGPRKINKKKQLIESFPVPNTKSDILEFLLLLKPKASDTKDLLVESYLNKYQECLERAKTFFGDDPDFKPFVEAYPKMKSNLKHGALGRWIKSHQLLTLVLVWLLLNLLFIPVWVVLYSRGLFEDNNQTTSDYVYEYVPNDYSEDVNAEDIVELLDSNFINEAKSSLEEEDNPELQDLVLLLEVERLLDEQQLHDAMIMAEKINKQEHRETAIDAVKNRMVDSLLYYEEYEKAVSLAKTLISDERREDCMQYVSQYISEKKGSNSGQ